MAYEINDRVKKLRAMMKLSQVEFCEILTIKQGTLSDIERNRINVSHKTVDKIAETMGVSKEWLYTGNGYIFIEKNDNVKYGIDIQYNLQDTQNKRNFTLTNETRLKVISFWQKVFEADKDLDNSITALNELEGLKLDLDIYIRRLNSIFDDIDKEALEIDYKTLTSNSFIKDTIKRLEFLKKHHSTITELNTSIESVLCFVDHDAKADKIGGGMKRKLINPS